MKHLLVSLAMVAAVGAAESMAAEALSPGQMQALLDGSKPLPTGDPTDLRDGAYAPDGVYAPESPGPAPSGNPDPAPRSSTYGGTEGEWAEYAPPSYVDGITSVGACCETCGRGNNCPAVWSAENDVFVWSRSKVRGITTTGTGQFVTVFDPNTMTNVDQFQAQAVMGTRSTAFDGVAGYGALIRRYLWQAKDNRDLYVEGGFAGLNTWREKRAFNATERMVDNTFAFNPITYGNLFSPFTDPTNGPQSGVGGFDRADRHEIYYESRLHNVEVNLRMVPSSRPDRIVLHPNGRWRRECQPGIYGEYTVGIRWFSLTEQFNFLSTGRTDVFDNGGNLIFTADTMGTYDIDSFNDLLGLQAGMKLMYRRCTWEWGAEAKACPAVNFASYRARVVSNAVAAGDPFAATDLNSFLADSTDKVAFLGQVSVLGYYHFGPHLSARVSWDMMWAVGVAMAPEQLQFEINPVPRVNANGTAFYQGVTLGLIWER